MQEVRLPYVCDTPPTQHRIVVIIFIPQWIYSPLFGLGLFFSFVIFLTQKVGLLGRVISSSQSRYVCVHTGQNKHRLVAHTNIYSLNEIRTHYPNVRANENSSCLRPCGHCVRRSNYKKYLMFTKFFDSLDILRLCHIQFSVVIALAV
jgi:hypothetical protein